MAGVEKQTAASRALKASKKAPVADSWEDEADDLLDGEESPSADTMPKVEEKAATIVTPLTSGSEAPDLQVKPEAKRQQTSDMVARRLITAALGIRAPKSSADRREYDKSIKEQHLKRRERERADMERVQREKREMDELKAKMWEGDV